MRTIAIALVLLAGCGTESRDEPDEKPAKAKKAEEPEPGLPMSQGEFLAALRTKLGDALTNGAEVHAIAYRPATVTLKVLYPAAAAKKRITPTVGELDARMVVGASVKLLIENGWNPRERMTRVTAAVRQQAPPSVTGGDQVFKVGTAAYDFVSDRVEFDPNE
jgi:hypothetical protein